jgi:hypothetical protein
MALVAIVGVVAFAERGACECACEARAGRSIDVNLVESAVVRIASARAVEVAPEATPQAVSNARGVSMARTSTRPTHDVAHDRSEPTCPRGGCPDDCPDCEDGAASSALAHLAPSAHGLDRPRPTWIPEAGVRGDGAPPRGVRSDVFRPPRASNG